MKQVLVAQGQIRVEEIPAPQVQPGMVLVRVSHSCISAGTEMSGVKASGLPLWQRALQRPDKVVKVLARAATQGITRTRNQIQAALSAGHATGYSASGVIVEVGRGVEDLEPGDRVACGGAQYANHAEVICVPRNLAVVVPQRVGLADACTVTMGAIALQGVRRAMPTLGESFVVMGMGILGQLTAQLLKSNGCRVVGLDLYRGRLDLARQLGTDVCLHPDDCDEIEQVVRLTDGLGADGVIITAASPSDELVSSAFKMCRRKGRAVLVGDVGLNLNRADFYSKELDFLVSTSYGPGRYDRSYEERGLDYPVAYVRWTENRNMAEYLRLIEEQCVRVEPLVSSVHPVDEAATAYDSLERPTDPPLMVLLSYPEDLGKNDLVRTVRNPLARKEVKGRVRLALIGASGFTRATHIPNLAQMKDRYQIRAVMSRTGANASSTAKHCGAQYSTTDFRQVLDDPEVDAVLIATRHHLHAQMTLQALVAGKHVLVEKPLALNQGELSSIREFYRSTEESGSRPVLVTGFNRRFSPFVRRLHELVKDRSGPMILNYRMNAGHVSSDHWLHSEEGGGRNLGEACHIYDLFTYLTDASTESVNAVHLRPSTAFYTGRDNFVATVRFDDGSVATLMYTSLGHGDHPKELLEVYVDGKVIVLNDYKTLSVVGSKEDGLSTTFVEKGHKEELVQFAEALASSGVWPAPMEHQIQATEIAFEVERFLPSPEPANV